MNRRTAHPIAALAALAALGGPALVSCAKISLTPPEEPVRASLIKALPPQLSVAALECSWLDEGQGAHLCRFKATLKTEADLYMPADRGARAAALGITDQGFIYGRFAGVQFISLASPKGTGAEVFGRVSVAKYGDTWQAGDALIEGGGSLDGRPLASWPQGVIVTGSPEEAALKAEHDRLVADRLRAQEEQQAAMAREQQAKAEAARAAEELRLKRVAEGKAAMAGALGSGRKWKGILQFRTRPYQRTIEPIPIAIEVERVEGEGAAVVATIRAGKDAPEPCVGSLVLTDKEAGTWRCEMVWKDTKRELSTYVVDRSVAISIGADGNPVFELAASFSSAGGTARLEPAQ